METDSGSNARSPQTHILWGHTFTSPIVAVFDIVKSGTRSNPFALLQPRSRLQDILPGIDLAAAARSNRLPNLESAYIGLLPSNDGGSLFAMSPDRFPLIVFNDANSPGRVPSTWRIDPPPGLRWEDGTNGERDLPMDVESVTKMRRLREMCKNGSMDPRCLTGVRPLEADSRSRLSRLLDGAPSPPSADQTIDQERSHEGVSASFPNSTGMPSGPATTTDNPIVSRVATIAGESGLVSALVQLGSIWGVSTLVISLLTAVAGATWLLYSRRSQESSALIPVAPVPASIAESVDVEPLEVSTPAGAANPPKEDLPTILAGQAAEGSLSASDITKPSSDWEMINAPTPTADLPPSSVDIPKDTTSAQAIESHEEKGVDGDDSDREADAAAIPGKKRVRRKARGKKKKGTGVNGINIEGGEDADDAEKTPLVEMPNPVETPILSIQTTPASPIVPQQLVVSEEVLG
jgi:serine/threonine-protein kinase/endoribonuclease IRE1